MKHESIIYTIISIHLRYSAVTLTFTHTYSTGVTRDSCYDIFDVIQALASESSVHQQHNLKLDLITDREPV